jgi:2-isopropylmalate synthase
MNYQKYRPYEAISLPDRQWPNNRIEKAPIWCSVDLRDGNQALPLPMGIDKKLKMFKLLVDMGYKEIEIGFPSASETEYAFARKLIDDNLIPDDVTIQVLTQSREHLIRKTFDALKGAKNAIIHLYNSTSEQQRRLVFQKSKEEIIEIGVNGAQLMVELMKDYPETNWQFQYSPESFPGTELDYALEICEAIMEVWQPTPENKAIINIPTTVELITPNAFADEVEWFCTHLKRRDSIIISIHPHNDRGTGVASAELAMLAGADRIEGTLFGNGERTGNVDNLTLAMNLMTQGVDPEIEFDSIDDVAGIYKECTGLTIHERHPYVGELVFTAFSGSHQDAIRKGLKAYEENNYTYWDVPYLPVDPADLGRDYKPIIRINSQSGKGGVAYILETVYGYQLPKSMHPEFSKIIQKKTDETGLELSPQEIHDEFSKNYLGESPAARFESYSMKTTERGELEITAGVTINGKPLEFTATGNGPLSAFFNGLRSNGFAGYTLENYSEHALGSGVDTKAMAYVQLVSPEGKKKYGVGIDTDINVASMKALLSSLAALQ